MDSEQNMTPQNGLIKVPLDYPKEPTPGKLSILLEENENSIYHRFSPYTENSGLISFGSRQPYIWVYPNEGNKGFNSLRKYESSVFPIGSAPIDVIRVTKFLTSGRGLVFLGKQFLLQTGNAFNETRIYNPTSPIVAAAMSITLGSVKPTRHLDVSGGLLGIAKSIIGSAIPNLFGNDSDIQAPQGTKPAGLPDINAKTDAKGLLRAGTSNPARARLESKWQVSSSSKGSGGFIGALKNLAKSVFGNFLPSNQGDDILYRGDEGAYGLMVGGGNIRFSSIGSQGEKLEFGQRWIGGGLNIRKNGQYPTNSRLLINSPNGRYWWISNEMLSNFAPRNEGFSVGYEINESSNSNSPGFRYGDNVGESIDKDFGSSDIMVAYNYYSMPGRTYDYPTKKSDKESSDYINKKLESVIDNLKKVSGGVYSINIPSDSRVISSPNNFKNGYNQLFSATNGQDRAKGIGPMQYPLGVLKDYRDSNVRMVDNSITKDVKNGSYKLPTAGHFDAINTLTVLDKDKRINDSKLKGWDKYDEYKDDLIAFYFFDVVNEKYIPFRATITGLRDFINSSWDELRFIGRGDRLYSYGGFNRKVSFNFKINISSLVELLPTWQRINYLSSLVKPANYTTTVGTDGNGQFLHSMNRFMVPPMVMLTLGDLYKYQPVLIEGFYLEVPEDASWETMNQESGEWSYLSNFIKSPNLLYGQLPREVKIDLNLILLEKERSVVGGANFGHAPRTDDYSEWRKSGIADTEPNEMHQSLLVDVTNGGVKYQ